MSKTGAQNFLRYVFANMFLDVFFVSNQSASVGFRNVEPGVSLISIVCVLQIFRAWRFGEKCRFSNEKLDFGWPFYMNVFIK